MSVMNRAVFLDRDGVLNRAIVRDGRPYPPRSMEEFEIHAGVADACQDLRGAGFKLVVFTNQPDVARGTQTRAAVEAFHQALRLQIAVDDILTCFHDDSDHCGCRKPKPGLILAAAEKYGIDLTTSYAIGDRWRDIDAGRSAGCKTIFIDHNYDERKPDADFVAHSLAEAARWIFEHSEESLVEPA